MYLDDDVVFLKNLKTMTLQVVLKLFCTTIYMEIILGKLFVF